MNDSIKEYIWLLTNNTYCIALSAALKNFKGMRYVFPFQRVCRKKKKNSLMDEKKDLHKSAF